MDMPLRNGVRRGERTASRIPVRETTVVQELRLSVSQLSGRLFNPLFLVQSPAFDLSFDLYIKSKTSKKTYFTHEFDLRCEHSVTIEGDMCMRSGSYYTSMELLSKRYASCDYKTIAHHLKSSFRVETRIIEPFRDYDLRSIYAYMFILFQLRIDIIQKPLRSTAVITLVDTNRKAIRLLKKD